MLIFADVGVVMVVVEVVPLVVPVVATGGVVVIA